MSIWRRRVRAARFAGFALFVLLPVVVDVLDLGVPWWGWLAAACVASYTGSVRMIVQRGWVADYDGYKKKRWPSTKIAIACFAGLPLMFVWPVVAIALLEPAAERKARHRREEAERAAAEARALRERERELGIGP